MVVSLDDTQCEPHSVKGRRHQGWRASGIFGLDGFVNDGALFLRTETRRSSSGQTPSFAHLPCDAIFDGQYDTRKDGKLSWLWWVQSYPSRTKDIDDVDFSTGSVSLGVAITSFASMIQDYVQAKSWGRDIPLGRMVALMGDAELDEGNIYECLQEGWKNDLRNTWWVIDYNRQSLDGIVREGLFERAEKVFEAFSWDVVRIKYGARRLQGIKTITVAL